MNKSVNACASVGVTYPVLVGFGRALEVWIVTTSTLFFVLCLPATEDKHTPKPMRMANKNLNAAKNAKKDEFYTQLPDIERELRHYNRHFCGKTVLCNCDDPYESNFFKYFALRFNFLGLKKLICTCYDGSPVAGSELLIHYSEFDSKPEKIAYKVEITEVDDYNGDGAEDLADVHYLIQNDKNVLSLLKGNGDFRSPECVELLKEADIVVTNPPFSLFREYVAQLMEYDKKFVIIGNKNCVTYKEIFPLFQHNKLWAGVTPWAGGLWFETTGGFYDKLSNGKTLSNVPAIWLTNLDHSKRHEEIDLVCRYTPEEYPQYDNYDAIEVSKTANIPYDYGGVMGVPITFLDKYNPDQFEIIGCTESEGKGLSNGLWNPQHGVSQAVITPPHSAPRKVYKRIFIRRKDTGTR